MNKTNNEVALANRVLRDEVAAEHVAPAAAAELHRVRIGLIGPNLQGTTSHDRDRRSFDAQRQASLLAIEAQPFHAMVEVRTEVVGESGKLEEREQTWYANSKSSTNEILKTQTGVVHVLAWTHPGVQLALATEIGDCRDVRAQGYRLRSVEPLAKARFDATRPRISAVYDPGGAIRPQTAETAPLAGLKAVKLSMTQDQVHAFVSRMSGLMIVTGAPGSGKTTVAFQRIRFLFDQQQQREAQGRLVPYRPELTRVFLANTNLAEQARELLATQLEISAEVVHAVDAFVSDYLQQVWPHKHDARPRQRKLSPLETAGRAAIVGLSTADDLRGLWETYEHQISARLGEATSAKWVRESTTGDLQLRSLAAALSRFGAGARISRDPIGSGLAMSALYTAVGRPYNAVREAMSVQHRNEFDEHFQHWLYWVYDPLAAYAEYFADREIESAYRIRRATGDRTTEADVLRSALADWNNRIYGPEDRSWLAWMLRFALPEQLDPRDRFREVPTSLGPACVAGERWTHVVVDEAQDLCVAETSLVSSLVDPDGALTVSADFKQIVSPFHGMSNTDALSVGRSLRGTKVEQIFPFARNMRQSKQIGHFLRGFYEAAFRERPTFEVNTTFEDKKPQLVVAPARDHALRIKQIVAVLRRTEPTRTVALLQINEDEHSFVKLRTELEKLSVPLAPLWAASGTGLLTTSVERIKGLEFDACVVLGLEGVESAALNFTLNRAYVAVSRPARRLAIVCGDFPPLLRRVDKSLFETMHT